MITPYYEESGITIYHGDCREILPHLPKVDLVLTDPPYGIGEAYLGFDDKREGLEELVRTVMPQIRRVSDVALLTPGVGNIWLYPEPNWTMCWFISGAGSTGKWGFSCWQPILAYGCDPWLRAGLGRRPDSFWITEKAAPNGHPCPKPIGVWSWLLKRGSVTEADLILDPFMGSGTTLVAAKRLGRRAIGVEIEEKYIEIAIERLRQEILPFNSPPEPVEIPQELLFT